MYRGLTALAVLLALAPAAAAAPPTTVNSTITGDAAAAYSTLNAGPGWARVVRQDLAAGATARSSRRQSLLYFAQLTDFQLADEESPSRVEFLDIDSTPFIAAWRPQEALEPFIVGSDDPRGEPVRRQSRHGRERCSRAPGLLDHDRRLGRQHAAQRGEVGRPAAGGRRPRPELG